MQPGGTSGAHRPSGIGVLLAIVVVGLATGAGFYRWQRSKMDARLAEELAAAPSSPAERAALWLRLSGPQIHHRLAVVGRFTPEMPWLVTHAVAEAEGPPELWGIDCANIPQDLATLEGLDVVVRLPRPVALGRVELTGDRAQRVPTFAPAAVPDVAARLTDLSLYLLEGIPSALERDVPGAHLVIRVE